MPWAKAASPSLDTGAGLPQQAHFHPSLSATIQKTLFAFFVYKSIIHLACILDPKVRKMLHASPVPLKTIKA
jgi:hypothetical protein